MTSAQLPHPVQRYLPGSSSNLYVSCTAPDPAASSSARAPANPPTDPAPPSPNGPCRTPHTLAQPSPGLVPLTCPGRPQVGAQDVAMGVKFSAACTLRCAEHPDGGAPAALLTCSTNPDDLEVRFPAPPPPAAAAAAAARTPGAASPSSSPSSSPEGSGWSADGSPASSGNGNGAGAGAGGPLASTSDITFELLEGDFQVGLCGARSACRSCEGQGKRGRLCRTVASTGVAAALQPRAVVEGCQRPASSARRSPARLA